MGRQTAATVVWLPPGGLSSGDAPPIVVVAKSAKLRFRLRRKLRPLPCSSSPHRAGRGGGPFWSRQKRNGPYPQGVCRIRKRQSRQRLRDCTVQREKRLARSGAVALRARRGSAYQCLLRFGLADRHA